MTENNDVLTGTGRQPASADLWSETERTRVERDETFDALESKMPPGQILEDAWDLTRGGTRAGASKLWHIVREHPLPATMIGVGLGWLLVESARGDGRSSADAVKDAAVQAKDAVKDAALHAKDVVKGAAASAGHRVADVTGDVRHRASELGDRTRVKATELKHRTRSQTRRAQTGFWQMMEENPLAVGAATLALGVLAGLSLPSTRREDDLVGETRDRLLDRLEEAGRETLDKGKQVAGTAVDAFKEEAENAGLTASGLAEKVREVGRHTKETVKEEVKNQGLTGEGSLTTGGVTTPSATAGTTGAPGTTAGSRERTTPRETITPVELPELSNQR